MPGNYNEYSRPSVASSGCAYATLDSYNQNYFGRGAVGAPRISQTASNQVVVVPAYGGPGYSMSQQEKIPSCSGYQDINNAYPNYPACNQFSSNMC
jgi:hypothetical protein